MAIEIYHVYISTYEGSYKSLYSFTKRKARKQFRELCDYLIDSHRESIEMNKEEDLKNAEDTKDISWVEYYMNEINNYQTSIKALSQMTLDNKRDKDWHKEMTGDGVNWKKVKVEVL